MASLTKRSWKLQEFVAHNANVNCLALGHKSGRVMVTGGDDKKRHKGRVNSLKFSPDGQWIASGGEDASVKIWDLRVGRVLREFKDHINSVTCVEFHPHEFLLASGSVDRTVNFSDLENFNLVSSEHDLGSVRCVCFNPDGECLFTGVRDHLKVVGWEPNRLYDSEPTMWGRICDISTAQNQLVGASFHLTNVMIYVVDLKKVHPLGRTTSEIPSPFTTNQSIRKSFSKAEKPVGLRNKTSIDVKTIEESTSGTDPEEESFADITNLTDYNEIFRGRSLTRTPPLEPEPFTIISDNSEIPMDPTQPQILEDEQWENFKALSLDSRINCPESPQPIKSSTTYSRSKSNLDQVYSSRVSKQEVQDVPSNKQKAQSNHKPNYQRQSSRENAAEKNHRNNLIKHSASDANISKSSNISSTKIVSRKNSFSKTSRNLSVPNVNVSKIPLNSSRNERSVPKSIHIISNSPVDSYSSPKISPDESSQDDDFVPVSIDRPVGLDLDDFLPKSHQPFGMQQQLPDMSETEVLGIFLRGHEPMMAVLSTRHRGLKIVFSQYRNKDIKAAFETAISLNDLAVIVDMLSVINQKYTIWSLDLCVLLLPKIEELLLSKFET
ncbi:katanin p80 subunit [Holotrichia oblita]|uniref:Katanin p80 subunit n=1 Tax=Holotrichia oblita TaxID=644536 RepID=A0ACB9TDN4_HOLOL|nr:katanin p80 subunit [Holotrichia oblita]